MISNDLLAILRCPQDRTQLSAAETQVVDAVNKAIRGRRLRNQAGAEITKPIDAGLVRADGRVLYPIVDGLPIMLADESISLAQVEGLAGTAS